MLIWTALNNRVLQNLITKPLRKPNWKEFVYFRHSVTEKQFQYNSIQVRFDLQHFETTRLIVPSPESNRLQCTLLWGLCISECSSASLSAHQSERVRHGPGLISLAQPPGQGRIFSVCLLLGLVIIRGLMMYCGTWAWYACVGGFKDLSHAYNSGKIYCNSLVLWTARLLKGKLAQCVFPPCSSEVALCHKVNCKSNA